MMKNIGGVITFENYVVEKVLFERNDSFSKEKEVKGEFDIKPDIQLSEDKKSMQVRVEINIFEDMRKNNFPFHMEVIVSGFFNVSSDDNTIKTDKFYPNAIAILYPYIRSIITTYTAMANVNPMILPTINVNKFIESNKKEM